MQQTKSGSNDWITPRRRAQQRALLELDQINASNVAQLKGAWMTRLGSGRGANTSFEADPLVINGVMYIPTGNDDIFALDAKTGKKIWEWDSDIPQVNDLICCGWDNRGVAAGDGMIYTGLLDGSFVALDQQTGKIAWRTQLEDYHDGYSITGATATTTAWCSWACRAAKTASAAGSTRSTPRRAKRCGGSTRSRSGRHRRRQLASAERSGPDKAAAYTHGGATVWQAPAIDPDLGMLYFSTGNAGPTTTARSRPGDSLFSASIVALDYKTGQYKWHFQEVHHDIWDFDAPSPTVLFDQTYNGADAEGHLPARQDRLGATSSTAPMASR